jgi:hypothetical protein
MEAGIWLGIVQLACDRPNGTKTPALALRMEGASSGCAGIGAKYMPFGIGAWLSSGVAAMGSAARKASSVIRTVFMVAVGLGVGGHRCRWVSRVSPQ